MVLANPTFMLCRLSCRTRSQMLCMMLLLEVSPFLPKPCGGL